MKTDVVDIYNETDSFEVKMLIQDVCNKRYNYEYTDREIHIVKDTIKDKANIVTLL